MFHPKRSIFFFLALMILAFSAPSLCPGAQDKKIPDYSLTERKDVPVEYTWRIEDIYPSLEAWKADKEAALKLVGLLDETAKGWTSSPQKMLALFDLLNDINGIGEMVVDSLCRSHACPLLASQQSSAHATRPPRITL